MTPERREGVEARETAPDGGGVNTPAEPAAKKRRTTPRLLVHPEGVTSFTNEIREAEIRETLRLLDALLASEETDILLEGKIPGVRIHIHLPISLDNISDAEREQYIADVYSCIDNSTIPYTGPSLKRTNDTSDKE